MRRILTHIGEPTEPARIVSARGPPACDDLPVDAVLDWYALAQVSGPGAFTGTQVPEISIHQYEIGVNFGWLFN